MYDLYWPCALMLNKRGEVENLFTYGPSNSLEKAKDQIALWRDGYGFNITESWIDVYDGDQKIKTIKEE